MAALGRGVVAVLILAVLGVSSLESAGVTPVWKIGRAVVEKFQGAPPPGWPQPEPGASGPPYGPGQPPGPGQPGGPGSVFFVLKVSLRNEGAAGNAQVQILGRLVANPPLAFRPLGTFVKEVAFKQTAILQMSLLPAMLAVGPQGRKAVELAVLTGHQETDRQTVPIPD